MAGGQDNVSTWEGGGYSLYLWLLQGPELFLLLSFLCRGVWCLVVVVAGVVL
jgi:hypothetical protein